MRAFQSTANNAVPVTDTLLDAAAAVEQRLRDSHEREHVLQRELQQTQLQLKKAVQYDHTLRHQALEWLVEIRRSHRNQSHASTTRLIREAVVTLETFCDKAPAPRY